MWFFLPLLILLCVSTSQATATFVHNFDVNGNFNEYLYETTNARIWDERPNGLLVRYWGPTASNIEGSITYKYSFDQPIESASLYANLLANRVGDRVYLDISTDGTNYTNLFTGGNNGTPNHLHPGGPDIPPPSFDLTSFLAGSTTAYVRARLIGRQLNSDIFSSQFLRTADSNGTFISSFEAPNVYQFSAVTTIPEPSSLLLILGCLSLTFGGRRSRRLCP